MIKPLPGQRYLHYKGQEYTIIAVGRDSETCEDVVIYRGNYFSDQFGESPVWVRPLSEFVENVIIDGRSMGRFQRID